MRVLGRGGSSHSTFVLPGAALLLLLLDEELELEDDPVPGSFLIMGRAFAFGPTFGLLLGFPCLLPARGRP